MDQIKIVMININFFTYLLILIFKKLKSRLRNRNYAFILLLISIDLQKYYYLQIENFLLFYFNNLIIFIYLKNSYNQSFLFYFIPNKNLHLIFDSTDLNSLNASLLEQNFDFVSVRPGSYV